MKTAILLQILINNYMEYRKKILYNSLKVTPENSNVLITKIHGNLILETDVRKHPTCQNISDFNLLSQKSQLQYLLLNSQSDTTVNTCYLSLCYMINMKQMLRDFLYYYKLPELQELKCEFFSSQQMPEPNRDFFFLLY